MNIGNYATKSISILESKDPGAVLFFQDSRGHVYGAMLNDIFTFKKKFNKWGDETFTFTDMRKVNGLKNYFPNVTCLNCGIILLGPYGDLSTALDHLANAKLKTKSSSIAKLHRVSSELDDTISKFEGE